MFGKKRKLELKVVKDQSTDSSSLDDQQRVNAHIREIGANTSVILDNAVLGGLMLIGAYFAADTIRHCVIHTVAVKVQPSVIVETAAKAKK